MFSISVDTEWVPQLMLDEMVEILNNYNIKATFFVTNSYDFSKMERHELAIHPNFEENNNLNDVLKKTISHLPTKMSKGSRSHKIFHTSKLLTEYKNFGIEYASNYYLPNYEKPIPFFYGHTDILEIPFFFADYQFSTSPKFDISTLNLNDDGVKVFLFHPFHIFINTHNLDEYESLKQNYNDLDYLESKKDYDIPGNRNIFFKILDYIKDNKIEPKTMLEINNSYRINCN